MGKFILSNEKSSIHEMANVSKTDLTQPNMVYLTSMSPLDNYQNNQHIVLY